MVKATQLTKLFEDKLNEAGSYIFKIFTDTGKYKKAMRKYNKITPVINGLYTVQTSDVDNTNNGLTVATMTSRIDFIVPCLDEEEDIYQTVLNEDGEAEKTLIQSGNETLLSLVRQAIDNVCSKNYFENMEDSKGNNYEVSIAYSLEAPGERQQLSETGDCFSFVVYAYYNIVTNGDNSRRWQVFLDGQQIPYLSMTIRRAPSQDSNLWNGMTTTKNTTSSTTFGISLELPAIVGKFNTTIKNYLLNGERNVVHALTVEANDQKQSYLVVFGDADATASGVLNVGQTVTFAEAFPMYGLVSFPSNFYTYKASKDTVLIVPYAYNSAIIIIPFTFNGKSTIMARGRITATIKANDIIGSSYQLPESILSVYGLTLIKEGS